MRNPFVGTTVKNTRQIARSNWPIDRSSLPDPAVLYQDMKVHRYDAAEVRAQLRRLMLK